MGNSTRVVKIGKCTVKITGVPDDITEEQIYSLALMKIFEMNKQKAIQEMKGFGKAS